MLYGERQIYHIERTIQESGKPFWDDSHIIYFNTSYVDNSPLGKLAEDLHATETKQMNSGILSRRVALLKNAKPNERGGKEMNVLLENYRKKALKEGIEKGREEEIIAKQKVIQLMGLLAEHGRIDDIKKSSIDQEYLQSLLLEFGL